MVTISEVLREAHGRLALAGCETARLDAEVLLAFVLGCDRSGLYSAASGPSSRDGAPFQEYARQNGVLERFRKLVERRCAREPVAYITGRREFRRITLAVDRRVLIPRPETELLVEVGLSLEHGVSVADVGTGSGAVALALKDERPDLSIVGVDLSDEALEVARGNATRLGLDVRFERHDLLDGAGDFDAVLANLPYVEDGTALGPEIALYEPRDALFAGADGLDLIRRLVASVDHAPVLALEVGLAQADAVESLVRAAGFPAVQRLNDLAGIERVVVGRR